MKKIGVTCDDYKAAAFRNGLLEDGYDLEFDGPSGVSGVHLFRIAVEDKDLSEMQKRISKSLKILELKVKRSN